MNENLRFTVRLVKAVALIAFVAGVVIPACGNYDTAANLNLRPAPDAPGQTTADAMVAAHDCWRGPAPKDVKVPGHVVVIQDGGAVYGGAALTGKALDQQFGDAAKTLEVVAFCR